jgi:hypothetical protein
VGGANLNEKSEGKVDVPLLACGTNAPRHVELDGLRECGLVESDCHADRVACDSQELWELARRTNQTGQVRSYIGERAEG